VLPAAIGAAAALTTIAKRTRKMRVSLWTSSEEDYGLWNDGVEE
jgi:hypothetical protein